MTDLEKEMAWNRITSDCFSSEYLESSPQEIKSDKKYVMMAIESNWDNFFYADPKFRDDKEVVMLALMMNWENIEFVSERLRNDKEIILEVVKTYWWWDYMPQKYLEDKDIQNAIEETKKRYKWVKPLVI